MYAQVEKPKENKSRAVAQKQSGGESTFQFADNRPEAVAQRKLKETINTGAIPLQLRSSKIVESSAQNHYNDGWGAKYRIQDDAALKTRVPDSVKGEGEIQLGIYESRPRWFYKGDQYKQGKKCNILYKDVEVGWGKYKSKSTSIFHCGPTGPAITKKV